MRGKFISFVVPAKNEEKSVQPLYQKITSVIAELKQKCEIIFVDDGSTDKTFEKLTEIQKKDKRVKVIKLRGNWGKSVALQTGFSESVGNLIFTLDADLQDNPKEIGRFLQKIDEGYDLVSGWKKRRHDPISKVIPSRIFNFATSLLTGVKVHDINSGFKAYKREVVESLNLYGELYRFIPIFAAKQNYKITEIEVAHSPRKFGKSKFGWERNLKGFLDLITVFFLVRYLKRPGHFFGGIGLGLFSIGFIIGAYIAYLRVTTGNIQDRHPLLYLGMLLMILGVQLLSTGLLGEMLTKFNQKEDTTKKYVEEILD